MTILELLISRAWFTDAEGHLPCWKDRFCHSYTYKHSSSPLKCYIYIIFTFLVEPATSPSHLDPHSTPVLSLTGQCRDFALVPGTDFRIFSVQVSPKAFFFLFFYFWHWKICHVEKLDIISKWIGNVSSMWNAEITIQLSHISLCIFSQNHWLNAKVHEQP